MLPLHENARPITEQHRDLAAVEHFGDIALSELAVQHEITLPKRAFDRVPQKRGRFLPDDVGLPI